MSNYVFIYKGGSLAETEQEQAAVMAAWDGWFAGLGGAVLDVGNPFGASASIASDGSVSDVPASPATGYSVLTADSLGAATTLVKDCPVLAGGGSVEVYEIIEIM